MHVALRLLTISSRGSLGFWRLRTKKKGWTVTCKAITVIVSYSNCLLELEFTPRSSSIGYSMRQDPALLLATDIWYA